MPLSDDYLSQILNPFSFAVQWSIGILATFLMMMWVAGRQPIPRFGAWMDVSLVVMISGTIGARFVHVYLAESDYFATYPQDIPKIWYRGLTWQGAIGGGIIGAWFGCWWRKISFDDFSDGLALAFPLGFIATWGACRQAGCGYAKAVESTTLKPSFFLGFLPNHFGDIALRFELQIIGVWLGLLLLALATYFTLNQQFTHLRLWIILSLAGGVMFLMGFWLNDPTFRVGQWRFDQVLSLFITLVSMTIGAFVRLSLQYRKILSHDTEE